MGLYGTYIRASNSMCYMRERSLCKCRWYIVFHKLTIPFVFDINVFGKNQKLCQWKWYLSICIPLLAIGFHRLLSANLIVKLSVCFFFSSFCFKNWPLDENCLAICWIVVFGLFVCRVYNLDKSHFMAELFDKHKTFCPILKRTNAILGAGYKMEFQCLAMNHTHSVRTQRGRHTKQLLFHYFISHGKSRDLK